MDLIHSAVEWMISWSASPYAVAALFVFAFWESSFFPIPPDPLLIAMAVGTPAMALAFSGVCTAASVLGAALGYFIGLRGGRPLAERFFKKDKILTAERLYQRYDVWAVGAAAFTPIPYKVFTITAGMARLRFWRFILVSIAGRGARFFALGLLIFAFGSAIQKLIDDYFEPLTIGFMVLLVLGFVAIRYISAHLARREAEKDQRGAPE